MTLSYHVQCERANRLAQLEEILGFYQQKYPNHSVFRALRSLTYFEDAEDQFMPRMFVDDTWEDIKQFIVNKVKTIKL